MARATPRQGRHLRRAPRPLRRRGDGGPPRPHVEPHARRRRLRRRRFPRDVRRPTPDDVGGDARLPRRHRPDVVYGGAAPPHLHHGRARVHILPVGRRHALSGRRSPSAPPPSRRSRRTRRRRRRRGRTRSPPRARGLALAALASAVNVVLSLSLVAKQRAANQDDQQNFEALISLIKELDTDGDGLISKAELKTYFHKLFPKSRSSPSGRDGRRRLGRAHHGRARNLLRPAVGAPLAVCGERRRCVGRRSGRREEYSTARLEAQLDRHASTKLSQRAGGFLTPFLLWDLASMSVCFGILGFFMSSEGMAFMGWRFRTSLYFGKMLIGLSRRCSSFQDARPRRRARAHRAHRLQQGGRLRPQDQPGRDRPPRGAAPGGEARPRPRRRRRPPRRAAPPRVGVARRPLG